MLLGCEAVSFAVNSSISKICGSTIILHAPILGMCGFRLFSSAFLSASAFLSSSVAFFFFLFFPDQYNSNMSPIQFFRDRSTDAAITPLSAIDLNSESDRSFGCGSLSVGSDCPSTTLDGSTITSSCFAGASGVGALMFLSLAFSSLALFGVPESRLLEAGSSFSLSEARRFSATVARTGLVRRS